MGGPRSLSGALASPSTTPAPLSAPPPLLGLVVVAPVPVPPDELAVALPAPLPPSSPAPVLISLPLAPPPLLDPGDENAAPWGGELQASSAETIAEQVQRRGLIGTSWSAHGRPFRGRGAGDASRRRTALGRASRPQCYRVVGFRRWSTHQAAPSVPQRCNAPVSSESHGSRPASC